MTSDECIWVADSNLFHSANSRRYLFGLAATTNSCLALVPTLLSIPEIPSQIAYGLLTNRHQKDRELNAKLTVDVRSWLMKKVNQETGLIKLFDQPDNTEKMQERIAADFNIFKRDPVSLQIGNDYNIITEALGAGCSCIATMNFRSIDHDELNDQIKSVLGFNEKFIVMPDELSNKLVRAIGGEALIIASMTVSDQERPLEAEIQSWEYFRVRLGQVFRLAAYRAKQAIVNVDWEENELILQGRELARTPRFQKARQLESELQLLRLDTLEWGVQQGVCKLDQREQDLVDRHVNTDRSNDSGLAR